MDPLILILILLGSGLMIYNIIGFIRFALFVKKSDSWHTNNFILYVPIILLVFFLLGYLFVAFFGNPDLIMAGILFGGSVFVFIMYLLLNKVTRQIMVNEQLRSKLMAAEESNQTKTEFLASVSHEMRTPMNAILGISSLALKNPDLDAKTRKQMVTINRSGTYLLRLINNILDLNKMESGTLTPKNEPFRLNSVITQVEEIARLFCQEKGLTFRISTEENLPDTVIGDEMMLVEVLLSLLDNAVKYTDAPGTISFRTERDKSPYVIRFTISDTGVGIDPDFLPKIFDLFSREDGSATTRYGGSGLGLTAAKKRTELMRGQITVESTKHKGSTFTVMIPLAATKQKPRELVLPETPSAPMPAAEIPAAHDGAAAVAAGSVASGSSSGAAAYADSETAAGVPKDSAFAKPHDAPPDSPPEPPADTDISLAGRRILIVEDLPENAEIVADLLDLEGVITEHAENGQIGLEMFQAAPPGYYDAILMDLRMPILNGLESARKIRLLDHPDAKKIPILALTANASENDVRQSMAAGMNAHLVKPVDADELYAELKHFIKERNEIE